MIPIRLVIDNITDDLINIDIYGFTIKYQERYYIVTVHLGLPIKEIIIDGIPKIENYILSKRNDLLIIPVLFPLRDQLAFHQFDEKLINYNQEYYCGDNIVKLKSNVFLPINMIPNNPTILYHLFTKQRWLQQVKSMEDTFDLHTPHLFCTKNNDIKVGMPIHTSDNKLRGIVCRMDDMIYVLSSHYIVNTILKSNDLVQIKNNTNIIKIDNKMIKNDKIYCKYHKTYIPVDSYISYHMDVNVTTKQHITKKSFTFPFKNMIINSNELIRDGKGFVHTSGYLNLLQILGEYEMINRILLPVSVSV